MTTRSMKYKILAIATCVTTFICISSNVHAEPPPGYNNKIPGKIMTPHNVETRIGALQFFNGMPSAETVKEVYDNLDFLRGECECQVERQSELLDPFDPLVVGDNTCYMVQAHFPKDALNALLPDHLTIPDDDTMTRYYPGTELKVDAHPFMLSFCHGSNIHDVFTEINVPEQEEIMFVFPVIYTHNDGDMYLCSYVPVLYLDSFAGVVGGLFFGLRKEYHPEMKHGEDAAMSKWWDIEDIIDASFVMQTGEEMSKLPSFFEQTFANPFVTISYPLPFPTMVFYQADVYPDTIRMASETFEWNYRGTTVRDSWDTWSVYSEYYFTMSQPMKARKYFDTR